MESAQILGEPAICVKCGAVGSIHTCLNTETDELTVECIECGQPYENAQAEAALRLLGQMLDAEEGSWYSEES